MESVRAILAERDLQELSTPELTLDSRFFNRTDGTFISDFIAAKALDCALTPSRVVAHVMASRIKGLFGTVFEAAPASASHLCFRRLWKGRIRACREDGCLRVPGEDHPELWRRFNGSGNIYVMHPYDLSRATLAALEKFCTENALDFAISASSWYYPGWSHRVMVWRLDQPVDDSLARHIGGQLE